MAAAHGSEKATPSKARSEHSSKSSSRGGIPPLDIALVTATGPSDRADTAASFASGAGPSEKPGFAVSFDVDSSRMAVAAGSPKSTPMTPQSYGGSEHARRADSRSASKESISGKAGLVRQATAAKQGLAHQSTKNSLSAAIGSLKGWTRSSQYLDGSDPSEASDFSFIMRDDDAEELQAYKQCGFLGDDDSEASEGGIADNELMNANDRLSRALWYIRQQRNLLRVGNQGVVEEESRFKAWIEMDEILLLVHEEKKQRNMKRWARFDTIFGVFVCLNGAMLGLTTQNPQLEENRQVFMVEIGFLSLFTVEWCIRWYFKPTGFCGMIREVWTRFDLIVLLISFVDIVVLELLNFKSGASLITVLRVFRLMRLIRLVRLLKLLKELWMLVSGMLVSVRILAWALFMFAVMCYIFGLFMVELVRNNLEGLEATQISERLKENLTKHWLGVPQTMLSMAQIATHSGHDLIRELCDLMGFIALPVLFSFIFIASLGLLNLIVGVLLTTSLRLAHRDNSYQDTLTRLAEHRNLRALRELLIARCNKTLGTCVGSPYVSRSMMLGWVNDHDSIEDLHKDISQNPNSWVENPGGGGEGSMELGPVQDQHKDSGHLSHSFKQNLVATSFRRQHTLENFLTRTSTRHGLAASFASAGITEDEIHMIFNETDSVNGSESCITLDEFIDGCILLKGQVHELDVVNMLYGIRSLYRRMLGLKSSLNSTLQALRESSEQVSGLLQRYHVRPGAKEEYNPDEDGPTALDEEDRKISAADRERARNDKRQILLEQEAVLAHREFARLEERRNWDNFDFFFSIVVFVNALVLGLEVVSDVKKVRDVQNPDFDAMSTIWFIVDFAFFTAYVAELWLRLLFHYQMREQHDFRRTFKFLPKLMILMDRETALAAILSSPKWFKDWRNLLWLDALVVAITIVDNCVLRVIDGGGDDYSKTLKLFGLCRLIRLARLLHLVRPLEVLVKGFIGNVKLIFWCLAMLLGLIYAGSITLVELVGKDEASAEDPAIKEHWSNVGTGMLTMAQIVTYNSWTKRVEELAQHHFWLLPLMLVFVSITSLGILNLVTGVMVQAAFRIVIDEGEVRRTHKLNLTKVAIQEAITRAFRRAEKEVNEARETMRKRIRVLRQVILDSSVAADFEFAHSGRADSVVQSIRPALRRLGAQLLGRGDQIAKLGAEEALDPNKGVVSFGNPTNYCVVVHSTWTAPGQVAIGIRIVDDGKQGAHRNNPLHSVLAWEGGRTTVGAFILDDDLTKEPSQGEGGDPANSATPSPRKEGAKSPADGNTPRSPRKHHHKGPKHNLGELIFSEVPANLPLRFRFGGNYSFIAVYPNHAPTRTDAVGSLGDATATTFDDGGNDDKIGDRQIPLEDVLPVDKSVVTLRELGFLVQDPILVRKLKQVDLRPEQALMVYQILNVNATGKVKVGDFIEGLLRIRRQEVGLDTAGAKSLMRRLRRQVAALSKSAYHLSSCFTIAVQRLRGCSIIEQMDDGLVIDEETMAVDRRNMLVLGNQQLKIKIERLKNYVQQRKKTLAADGDLHLVAPLAHSRDEDDTHSVGEFSIHSASPGWD